MNNVFFVFQRVHKRKRHERAWNIQIFLQVFLRMITDSTIELTPDGSSGYDAHMWSESGTLMC